MSAFVLVLGGAGFIGSRIAFAFEASGDRVTILDGLLPKTGGRKENLSFLRGDFIEKEIAECADLPKLIAESQFIVDAMGWTCHRLALRDPAYDLELNVRSHLELIQHVPKQWPGRIIYLGSRGQFGNPNGIPAISEDTPQVPEDVQGIHKSAAESHFRIGARLRQVSVASLRIPAAVGPNQPAIGEDIGLFGGFARDLWAGHEVDLYGADRRREVIHVDDIAATVVRLARADWQGFQPYNLSGHSVLLKDVLEHFRTVTGKGEIRIRPAPPDVAAIDIGAAPVDGSRLAELLGDLTKRSVQETLQSAVDAFRP